MVDILGSFRAYMYQAGIDRIRHAFRISISTMQDMQRQASEAHTRYLRSGEDDSQYDEDGCLISSLAHELSHNEFQASLASEVVRKAFTTSAFHYWELSVRTWTGRKGFDNLKASSPYSTHDQLPALNTLNNLIKHGGADLALKLYDLWPALFSSKLCNSHGNETLYWRLAITNEVVEKAFEIIRASGPSNSL